MEDGAPGLKASRIGQLVLILASSLLVAWFASTTPRALSPQTPLDRFAAGRAMADITRLAAVAHPLGSPADAAVRAQLIERLRALGLSPQTQHVAGVRPWGSRSTRTYAVDNVLARLPGTDRLAPALLLMSHYDSVPNSPGAADDMASVASALEIARLLARGGPPRRDILFAFTDGEEAGLLGAQALFADPRLSRNIGFVINMDVRGGGGRAMMFQLGRRSGGAADQFARTAERPQSNSLAAYIYEKMPNDTDFTVAMAHDLAGLNYAFIGRPNLYHTPAAIPSAVEPGAVQSLGDQVWAVTRRLAVAARLPPPAPEPVWFDVFGRGVVRYPPPLGWLPIALSVILLGYVALRERAAHGLVATLAAISGGVARNVGATLIAALLLALYGHLFISGYYQGLGLAGPTEIATALVVLCSALLVFNLGPAPRRPVGQWLGAAGLGWLIAVVLQAFAPLTAFLAAWPVLAASASIGLYSRWTARAAVWAAMAVSVLALGFLMETWHAVILGVGLTMPVASAALCPLAFAVLSPFLSWRQGASEAA